MNTGVTFNASAEILPAGTRLRLLRDRILLKPLDWEPSKIITVIRRGRPLRGTVCAIGPGRYHRVYTRDKSSYRETNRFIPTTLRVGDVVELGGLNVFEGQGYNFTTVTIGAETFIVIQEQDVACVYEEVAA